MSKFTINSNLCKHCGICSMVCPKGLIEMIDNTPVMSEKNSLRCNNCGQCVAYCPEGCAQQVFSDNRKLEKAHCFSPTQTHDFLCFLRSRRSYRNFSSIPVSRETINQIIETANYAPSGGNNRKLRWIVLESPQQTQHLSQLIAQWFDKIARHHPVYSQRYAIDSILHRYHQGKDVILRGAPHIVFVVCPNEHVWAEIDTGIALTYFNFACEALDIGCCFAGYATKAAQWEEIREFLHLEANEKVSCALCFGQKTLHPYRIPNRGSVPVSFI